MSEASASFAADDAAAVTRELRASLGLAPETFPLPAFVAMISDEIEQYRAAGKSDSDIATAIKSITGKDVDAAAIASFYASPHERRGYEDGR